MGNNFQKLEQQYIGKITGYLESLDSGFSFISMKYLGETYFFLEAEKLKESKDKLSIDLANPEYEPPVDFLTVFQSTLRIIIAGEPGAGKSTSLMYMAMLITANYAYENKLDQIIADLQPFVDKLEHYPFTKLNIPVYIRLKDISEKALEDCSFMDMVVKQVNRILPDDSIKELVNHWNHVGKLTILLDGLDEIQGQSRIAFLNKLYSFINNNVNTQIALSSRLTGTPYTKIQKKAADDHQWLFTLYHLLPLKDRKAPVTFSIKWLNNLGVTDPQEKAESLINAVATTGGLIKVIRNPMLLRMLIHVYRQENYEIDNLPISRMRLYEHYIREVVLEKAGLKYYAKDENFSSMMEKLEYVAWFIHGKNQAVYKNDLIEKLRFYFPKEPDWDIWLERFVDKMRLLYKYTDEEQTKYEFSHQSFQEFFVARRLLTISLEGLGLRWVIKEVIIPNSWSSHYQEILLMFLKELSLILKEFGFSSWMIYRFCKMIIPEDSKIGFYELLTEGILDDKLASTNFLSKKDRNKWNETIFHFLMDIRNFLDIQTPSSQKIEYHESQSIPRYLLIASDEINDSIFTYNPLPTRLHNTFTFRGINETEEFRGIGDTSSVHILVKVLKDKNENMDIRRIAARALGRKRDSSVIPFIMAVILDKNEDAGLRSDSTKALGRLGDYSEIQILSTMLYDEDRCVRINAAEALGVIGDPTAVPILIKAIYDEDEYVQKEAVKALGWIGDSSAVSTLIAVLNNDDEWMRGYAAEALGRIGDSSAAPALSTALKNENPLVRKYIAKALGKIGETFAVPALANVLKDVDTGVRMWAAKALGEIGDASAVPALSITLSDEYENVREYASWALGNIGDPSAIPALLSVLNDEHTIVREKATGALGEIGDSSAIPALLTSLRDEHKNVREYAAWSLREIGYSYAYPELSVLSTDEFFYMSKYSSAVYKKVNVLSLVSALTEALNDEFENVRQYAAEVLGMIGHSAAIEPLLSALNDEDEKVRENAAVALEEIRYYEVEALGRFDDASAIPSLMKILRKKNESDNIRKCAINALVQINNASAVSALKRSLKNKNLVVQKHAALALGEIGNEPAIMILKHKFRNKETQRISRSVLDQINVIPTLPDPINHDFSFKQSLYKNKSSIIIILSSILASILAVFLMLSKNIFTGEVICKGMPGVCNYVEFHSLVSIGVLFFIPILLGLCIDFLRKKK